jgi:predicted TIM-barrel fold metal-dependent hydrolase
MLKLDRRSFVAGVGAGLIAGPAAAADVDRIPVIDTCPHLWDPKRPISTVYMPNGEGRTAAQLRHQAPKGMVGAVVMESSPWFEDNLWLLQAVKDEPFVVGIVGNLQPDARDFPIVLDRYHRDPMYLGIRHGNVWPTYGYNLPEQIKTPAFIDGLRLLAQAGLVLDLANPRLNLLQAALRINDAVPDLKVVVDHLGGFRPKPEDQVGVERVLREYEQRPNVFGKLSLIRPLNPDEPAAATLAESRSRLDHYFGSFGEDRIIGGGSYTKQNFEIYRLYWATKSRTVAEKGLWKNSARVYRWQPRRPDQPRLA